LQLFNRILVGSKKPEKAMVYNEGIKTCWYGGFCPFFIEIIDLISFQMIEIYRDFFAKTFQRLDYE